MPRNPASDEADRLQAALVAANLRRDELRARADHAEAILAGLLPIPLSDALLDARNHQSRTEGVSAPCDWGRTVGRAQVLAAAQPEVEAQRAEIARLRAGGCARDQGLTQFCAEAAARDEEIRRLRAELDAARPGVEWRHLPGSAGWERADVGRFSLLLMGDSAWRVICGDQAVIARGSPGGDAGKAACYAAYLRACGLPPAPAKKDSPPP